MSRLMSRLFAGPASVSPFLRRYYLAHFGKSLFWYLSSILFAYYLTEACGLAPATMGLVLAATLALNAVADATMGMRLARHVAGIDDACRAQFIGAIAASLAIVGFACTAMVPEAWRLGYAIVALCAFRLSYSLFDVPQNAILGFAGRSDGERTRIAGARQMLSATAQFVIAILFVPLLRGTADGELAMRFLYLVGGACLVAVSSAAILRGGDVPEVHAASAPEPRLRPNDRGGIAPPLMGVLLLTAAAIFAFVVSTIRLVEPYVASFVLASQLGAAFLTSLALGQLVGPLLWSRFSATRTLDRGLRAASLLMLLATCGFLFMDRGIPATAIVGIVHGIAIAGISQMVWAMAARWSQAGDGRATRHFGLLTFSTKGANALASLAFGLLLSVGDYRAVDHGWSIPFLILIAVPAAGALVLLTLAIPLGRQRRG